MYTIKRKLYLVFLLYYYSRLVDTYRRGYDGVAVAYTTIINSIIVVCSTSTLYM